MYKHFFASIILISISISLIAQIKYEDLQFRDDKAYFKGKLYTGVVIGSWTHNPLIETNYINGSPNGLKREYYPNKFLKSEEYIKSTVGFGKINGPKYPYFNFGIKKVFSDEAELILLEEYFADGSLKISTEYITLNDSFYDNGYRINRPISIQKYISSGIYEFKKFHQSSGKLKEIYKKNYNVKNSFGEISKFGPYKRYFENGQLQEEGNIALNFTKNLYSGDLLTGVWKFYFENGQLESTGLFSIYKSKNMSHKDKEWKYYYKNGFLKEKGSYKADEWEDEFKIGKWVLFFENGKLDNTRNYVNNKLEGDFIKYNNDGSIFSIKKYWDGKEIQ